MLVIDLEDIREVSELLTLGFTCLIGSLVRKHHVRVGYAYYSQYAPICQLVQRSGRLTHATAHQGYQRS